MPYIYKNEDWPRFTWNAERLVSHLSATRYEQGRLLGKMQDLGHQLKMEATLAALTGKRLSNPRRLKGRNSTRRVSDRRWLGAWDSKPRELGPQIEMWKASLR